MNGIQMMALLFLTGYVLQFTGLYSTDLEAESVTNDVEEPGSRS